MGSVLCSVTGHYADITPYTSHNTCRSGKEKLLQLKRSLVFKIIIITMWCAFQRPGSIYPWLAEINSDLQPGDPTGICSFTFPFCCALVHFWSSEMNFQERQNRENLFPKGHNQIITFCWLANRTKGNNASGLQTPSERRWKNIMCCYLLLSLFFILRLFHMFIVHKACTR